MVLNATFVIPVSYHIAFGFHRAFVIASWIYADPGVKQFLEIWGLFLLWFYVDVCILTMILLSMKTRVPQGNQVEDSQAYEKKDVDTALKNVDELLVEVRDNIPFAYCTLL